VLYGIVTLWRGVFLLELMVLCAPLFLIDYPPLGDLPNHLARLYILSTHGSDPVLSLMWRGDWHIVPDLAIDIVGPPLINLTSVENACRLILIAIVTAQLSGAVLLHRAMFGRRSYWPLSAGLIIYNNIFLLGFLNYLLGIGLAMIGASAWISQMSFLRQRRIVVAVIFSLSLFFCHIVAVLFYLLLIGAWQLAAAVESGFTLAALRRQLLPLALPVALPAILFELSRVPNLERGQIGWSTIPHKIFALLGPFVNYSIVIDVLGAAAIIAGLLLFIYFRKLDVPKSTQIALAALFAVYVVCPAAILTGNYLDARLPILMGFIVVSGTNLVNLPARNGVMVGIAAGLVVFVRLGFLSGVWIDARADLEDFRSMEAFIFPGARILVMTASDDAASYFRDRHRSREVRHFGATSQSLVGFWVIERRVFWPLLFADPSQQPIRVLSPYDRIAVPSKSLTLDYRLLAAPQIPAEALIEAPYLASWQSNFDFVVVVSVLRAEHLDAFDTLPLTLVKKTPIAALYKIRK